jgi:HEPN domain-containing protein
VTRRFTTADGFKVRHLLHYGCDSISAARHLLKSSASYFDSAGYLAHIGVELLLKAWHLEVFGCFTDTHNLQKLWEPLAALPDVKALSSRSVRALAVLDAYEHLRYPTSNNPIEVGSAHAAKVDALVNAIWQRVPTSLKQTLETINPVEKGGRVLMKRPIKYRPPGT